MYLHVAIWPTSGDQQRLGELYVLNLSEDQLHDRIIEPYETGASIVASGRALPPNDISWIRIVSTVGPQAMNADVWSNVFHNAQPNPSLADSADVTDLFVTMPPGARAAARPAAPHATPQEGGQPVASDRDPRRVMVVHGRNRATRDAMFQFLRSLALDPIEWEAAVAQTGMGSPHNLDAVIAAMASAQAVIVVLTAEDRAGLLPALSDGRDEELELRGQPRQNVILEAGLAMGVDRGRTILVELGPIRRASDFDGLNTVRLTNDVSARGALRTRLKNAGCAADDSWTDWLTSSAGGDFDSSVASPPENDEKPGTEEGTSAV